MNQVELSCLTLSFYITAWNEVVITQLKAIGVSEENVFIVTNVTVLIVSYPIGQYIHFLGDCVIEI